MIGQYRMGVPSWHRKLDRAEQHLRDLESVVAEYISGHFYGAKGSPPSKRDPYRWRFNLEITREPDPMTTVLLGDFLFDVRSALDHLAVALAPNKHKSSAGFPINDEPLFIRDASRCYIVRDSGKRKAFRSRVKWMPPEAIAIIKQLQPYNFGDQPGRIHSLFALNALQNADKHRRLTILGTGLTRTLTKAKWQHETWSRWFGPHLQRDAVLVTSADLGTKVLRSEVEVEVSGLPFVSVEMSGEAVELIPLARNILSFVRSDVIAPLEPFARP